MVEQAEIGVIGGSGLQALAAHSDMTEVVLETPFGSPSGPYRVGTVAGRKVAFLARHGAGHRLLPSEVPYRANVFGMKMLGVTRLVSASAVGSLREDLPPRHFVVVDQFIDRTWGRASTFFGDGLVAHVGLADPTCSQMRPLAAAAAREAGAQVREGGTYVCIQGPQFSTRAESKMHRAWGADVVGMTNVTEARLAREAELCYCSLAMVTDYDCWREGGEDVSVDMLLEVLHDNAARASDALGNLVASLPRETSCPCTSALATALITDRKAIPGAVRSSLRPLVGKYLDES
jgi:5'-methylthioadenosine phosphorylase